MKVRFSNSADAFSRPGELFGRRLGEARRERGLSQTELAQRMTQAGRPLSKAAVLRIENGTRRVTLDEALAFAKVLYVPFADLLEPPRDGMLALTEGFGVDREGLQRWLVTGDAIRAWPERIVTRQDRELAAAYLRDLAVAIVGAVIRGDKTERDALQRQFASRIGKIEEEAKRDG